MNRENLIQEKTYAFAVKIVKTYKHLSKDKKEFILSKQLLRCGTSIGANVEEATGGTSKREFAQKLRIAYREARETGYWLRLLTDTEYLTPDRSAELSKDCDELCKILYSIIKSST